MAKGDRSTPLPPHRVEDKAERIHRWVFGILQGSMTLGAALAIYEGQWLNAVVIVGIILLMFVPTVLGRRFKVRIPAEFEILALLFVFAALFLGEVRGFYARLWWWDVALHTASGFLLGILGFLLVFVLNETKRIEMHMRPGFVALFAFVFAVAIGALWEIFEFTMDQTLGLQMQKPTRGDPSGLTDTMFDLIVDAIGALVISLLGWWHMTRRTESFLAAWIRKFIERNPHLFRR